MAEQQSPYVYEARLTSMVVLPKGRPVYSEMATTISIDDEAAGEYLVIEQVGLADGGKLRITAEEWPTLRRAINRMAKLCRDEGKM